MAALTIRNRCVGCRRLGRARRRRSVFQHGFDLLQDGGVVDCGRWGELQSELVQQVREAIGPIACFRTALVVERLPKTRSGKVLRNVLRKIADGEPHPPPPTIDDPAILEEINSVLREHHKST